MSVKPAALKKSLPYEIVEVKAKPRKAMRSSVAKQKDIVDWRPVGDRIRIEVAKEKTSELVSSLKDELSRNNSEIRILRKTRPLMEDVFTHNVNLRRRENA